MNEQEEEQFYSSFGSFCHDLIARFYSGELTAEDLLPEFLQGFCNRVEGERPSPEIERRYLDQGAFYFEHFEPFPLKTELVEEPVALNLDGLQFVGIIDYLGRDADGNLIVVDHKSADLKPRSQKKAATQTDRKLDEMLRQLYLYAEWVHIIYGSYPKELWFNCFRIGKIIKEPFDPTRLEEALAWVRNMVSEIYADDQFLPNDDYFYCRWVCGLHNKCDLFREEYGGRRRSR